MKEYSRFDKVRKVAHLMVREKRREKCRKWELGWSGPCHLVGDSVLGKRMGDTCCLFYDELPSEPSAPPRAVAMKMSHV